MTRDDTAEDIRIARNAIEKVATPFAIYALAIIALMGGILCIGTILGADHEALGDIPEGAVRLTAGAITFSLFFPFFVALYLARHFLQSIRRLEVRIEELETQQIDSTR